DPQLTATEFFHTVEQPGLGPVRLARCPIDLGTPPAEPQPAALLGQHTREVLADAGFAEARLGDLLAAGGVRDTAPGSAAPREVLADAGFAEDRIGDLLAAGVVRDMEPR